MTYICTFCRFFMDDLMILIYKLLWKKYWQLNFIFFCVKSTISQFLKQIIIYISPSNLENCKKKNEIKQLLINFLWFNLLYKVMIHSVFDKYIRYLVSLLSTSLAINLWWKDKCLNNYVVSFTSNNNISLFWKCFSFKVHQLFISQK